MDFCPVFAVCVCVIVAIFTTRAFDRATHISGARYIKDVF